MDCDICAKNPSIGFVYRLEAGHCFRCSYSFSGVDVATYKGMTGGRHVFQLHPSKVCPTCKTKLRYAAYPCKGNEPMDVTEEYRQLQYHRNPGSYWRGY